MTRHILADLDDDSASSVSPQLSRRSSASSAFFDENEFNFLARRRQGLKSPINSSPIKRPVLGTMTPESQVSQPSEVAVVAVVPTVVPVVVMKREQGLIRTVVREAFGIIFVEHWLLLQDVALCLWRYVRRVAARVDHCRVATFGLLQALA